jgi:hypothetical protein
MTALAGRQCGACTVCCTALQIDDPALHKKAGVTCRHLTAGGCGIYDSRPGTCREFLCGWRLFAELDDDWRPDISGLLVMRKAPDELPAAWRGPGFGVHLAITGGDAAIARPGLADYVLALMHQGVAVSMSAASPTALLNDHLDPGDRESMRQGLMAVWRLLAAARWRWKPLMVMPLYRLELHRLRHLAARKSSDNR